MADTKSVVWTQPALDDVDVIVLYIGRDSPAYASRLLSSLFAVADELAVYPQSGRVVPELARPDIRERIVGSYRLIYQAAPKSIRILAVIHASRDLQRLPIIQE